MDIEPIYIRFMVEWVFGWIFIIFSLRFMVNEFDWMLIVFYFGLWWIGYLYQRFMVQWIFNLVGFIIFIISL